MAKKRKINPNRFQKQDDQGLFSFDPIRRDVFKWGAIAGAAGGFLIVQQQIIWQILGVLVAVFIGNYHISKAARYIPRWHAAIISFIGMAIAMFGVVAIGAVIMAYQQSSF